MNKHSIIFFFSSIMVLVIFSIYAMPPPQGDQQMPLDPAAQVDSAIGVPMGSPGSTTTSTGEEAQALQGADVPVFASNEKTLMSSSNNQQVALYAQKTKDLTELGESMKKIETLRDSLEEKAIEAGQTIGTLLQTYQDELGKYTQRTSAATEDSNTQEENNK